MADELRKLMVPKMSIEEAYRRGYDAGLHGSNDHNSNFSIFQTEELASAWLHGKNDAKEGIPNRFDKA